MNGKMLAAGFVLAWQSTASTARGETAAHSLASVDREGELGAAVVASADPKPEAPPHDTLLPTQATLGGYGGPDMRITSLLDSPALLVGAQASWVAGHQFLFGAAGYALATQHDAPEAMRIEGNPARLGLAYGGVRFGVVAAPHRLLHLTIAVLAGPGTLTGISQVPTRAEFNVGYERRLGHAEMFLAVEPELAMEMNIASFMRAALGASYRYVTGVEHPGLSNATLGGPAASLALKFGVF